VALYRPRHFGGVSDTANSDYFKNQATDEPATGVAVALFDEAGNVMKNNEGVLMLIFLPVQQPFRSPLKW
jgi:type 1 fimbria pilin